jgi:hypothetical protein
MKRFIHIPKNAGTSIRSWVSPMDYNDTKEELPEYIKSIGMDKHLPHSKLKPNSMFDSQFAVVRNPWARMVSLYHDKQHPHTKTMSFLTFISHLDHFTYEGHWWCNPPHKCFAQQLDWISINSKPMIDVLPFNNLQENLSEYLGHQVFLEHLNRGELFTNYKSFYNDYSKLKVANHFAKDIEHFGFTFETEATRNIINGP